MRSSPRPLRQFRIVAIIIGAALVAGFLAAGQVHAQISFVEEAFTSSTNPLAVGVTKGDLLFLGCNIYYPSTTSPSVSDTMGDIWIPANPDTTDGNSNAPQETATWYAIATSTGSTTISFSSSRGCEESFLEYSGVAQSNPLDGANTSVASSSAYNSGGVTTANADDLLIGFLAERNPGDTWTLGSTGGDQYTARIDDNSDFSVLSMDALTSATGTYDASATVSSFGGGIANVAAFKESTSSYISSFSISPAIVAASGTAVISWNVVNASSVLLTGSNLNFSTSSPSGSVGVSPLATGTLIYTIQASNGTATTTATTSLMVDSIPPSVPQNPTITASTTNTLSLSWASSTDNVSVAGYAVYRCAGSCTPTSEIATTTATSFTDTGLSASTTYTYAVAAYDEVGNASALSANVVATTAPPPAPTVNFFAAVPDAITLGSSSQISWNVSNASSVVVTGNGLNLSTTTESGSVAVTPSATGTVVYTIQAADISGQTTTTTSLIVDGSSWQNIYIAENPSGSGNGDSCANAYAYTFFDTPSNWANVPTSGLISPGTTVHLCGVLTGLSGVNGYLTFGGSGQSGNPITLLFEPGAILQSPNWGNAYMPISGAIATNNNSWIVIDGGTTVGGIPNGIIQNTENGTYLTYQSSSIAIQAANCNDCEIKNLNIANIYIHSSSSDVSAGGDTNGIIISGSNWRIDHNVIHDVRWALNHSYNAGDVDNNIDHNEFYDIDHGIVVASNVTGTATNDFIYKNYFHDFSNWDTGAIDAYHHDGIHAWNSAELSGASTWGSFTGLYIYNNRFDGVCGENMNQDIFLEGGWNNTGRTPWTELFSSPNAFVYGNFFRCTDNPPLPHELVSIAGPAVVFNNTFIGNDVSAGGGTFTIGGVGLGGSSGLQTSTSMGLVVRNNLLSGENTLINTTGNASDTWSLVPDYNFYGYYAGSYNVFWGFGVDTADFTTWQMACSGCDIHSLSDPNALTVIDSNGIPVFGSSLIGNAENMITAGYGYLPGIGIDYNSTLRSASAAWDIGAYQYVPPSPSVSSFSSSPSTLTQGGSATLSWSVTNASSVVISGDALNLTTSTLAGSISVTPDTTGNLPYTLSASNAVGTSTASLSLTVNAPVSSGGGGGGGGGGGYYFAPPTPSSTPSSTASSSSPGNGSLLIASSTLPSSSSTIASLESTLSSLVKELCSLVQEARTKGIPVNVGSLCGGAPSFTKDLFLGMHDPEVKELQIYLNTHGFIVNPVPTYAGSPGYETSYFGMDTKLALEKFQASHGIPATGYFGPLTRGWIGRG